ncbi:MAG TPA: UDP-N-acetylmuramoyl-tripeptide--D-alanyl-D-alanine ligase [Deltaproteobacteria bacterium]|nr:UDP-N-acetylmuramoyl-tripeptide--D-alanyl-D-alanine ligase [Deltaproteobacteria bacterium]
MATVSGQPSPPGSGGAVRPRPRTYSIDELAAAMDAAVSGRRQTAVRGFSTDTRRISPGELFFALRGGNFDGHDFAAEAVKRGAIGVVASRHLDLPPGTALLVVDDTLRALGDTARYVRSLHGLPVITVTGSAGKTTTKDMTAVILSAGRRVHRTEGNRNNLIGLPLTLLDLSPRHEACVVELGISLPGEMERLAEIAAPDVAVITNIGRGHVGGLGSVEGVARAKTSLFASLGTGGVRVVNIDDPWIARMEKDLLGRGALRGERITFRPSPGPGKADVTVRDVEVDGFSLSVVYDVRGTAARVRFPSPWVCNAANGAAAAAAALALGATAGEIETGLDGFVPEGARMRIVRSGGLTILDDTYNANPESVVEALRALSASKGRKVAVMGEMLDLGDEAETAHREVGAAAADLGIDVVVAVGDYAAQVMEGAASAGRKTALHPFASKREAARSLKAILKEGDTVLVKGSRAAAMEEIIKTLVTEDSD